MPSDSTLIAEVATLRAANEKLKADLAAARVLIRTVGTTLAVREDAEGGRDGLLRLVRNYQAALTLLQPTPPAEKGEGNAL